MLGSRTLHQAMYNRDMADLLVTALFGPRPEHHLFNAPVERNYTDEAVLAAMRRVVPDARIHAEVPPAFVPKVPVMDGGRARAELGFVPRITLADGVREMVAAYRAEARTGGMA